MSAPYLVFPYVFIQTPKAASQVYAIIRTMAGGPPRKRRRPALSCCECRRRKVKCDREQPCNHCQQSKVSCVFSSDAASTEPQDVRERTTADGASTISNPSTATIGIAAVVTSPSNLSFGYVIPHKLSGQFLFIEPQHKPWPSFVI